LNDSFVGLFLHRRGGHGQPSWLIDLGLNIARKFESRQRLVTLGIGIWRREFRFPAFQNVINCSNEVIGTLNALLRPLGKQAIHELLERRRNINPGCSLGERGQRQGDLLSKYAEVRAYRVSSNPCDHLE